MKKKYLTYIIIAVVVIAVIVVISQVNKKKNMPEWRTETPSIGTIREVVTATGSLNPTMLVEVGTEVSGKIEKLYKDFNDTVKKGELLAKLDTEILAANLESAKADVNKATIVRDDAKMEYENSKTLYEKGMGSQYEMEKKLYTYQQAEQNLATAILKLKTAQKNLQNASITSPINGVVVSREVSEGQTVAATMSSPTLFKIANNLDIMEITAVVDEADIGKVKVGMPVEFTVDAYPEEQFYGTVNQIRLKSIVEQNVVSYNVIIDTDNPEHKLLPGMTTNVTIIIQSKEDVMRIPVTATRFLPSKEVWELFGLKWEDNLITKARRAAMQAASPGNSAKTSTMNAGNKNFSNGRPKFSTIWVLKDNVPELMVVQTGISDGAYIEVLSDLDQKAKIITGVNYKNASQITGNSVMGGPRGGRF